MMEKQVKSFIETILQENPEVYEVARDTFDKILGGLDRGVRPNFETKIWSIENGEIHVDNYICPCGSKLYEVDRELNMTCGTKFKYCPECGRKIDWSGVDK